MHFRHRRRRRQLREDRRQSATDELGKVEMTSDFGRLTVDYRRLTTCVNCDNPLSISGATLRLISFPLSFPQDLGLSTQDFSMGIDARVMAWPFAPQKVRACDTTATIRPSKSGHKRSILDAHSVSIGFSGLSSLERMAFTLYLLMTRGFRLLTDDCRLMTSLSTQD